uniref:Radial spoke protein 14 n=1 Tax=Caenorhabditis tropicalis TaxID=1561998 RepID=A0A1I7TWK7_9PELO
MSSDLEVSVDDLVKLLSPTMSVIVRRKTMEIVTQLGTPLDGSAGKYFQDQNFALGAAICQLCEATASDRTETLAALTNFTSGSIEAADFVLDKSKCVEIAYTAVVTKALYSSVASRLLVNVSRHFPDRVDQKLKARNADYMGALLNEIKKSVEIGDEDRAKFVGFTLVNLSVLPPIRQRVVGNGENSLLPIVCELLATAKTTEIRECAADVLRNLSFDDASSKSGKRDGVYMLCFSFVREVLFVNSPQTRLREA